MSVGLIVVLVVALIWLSCALFDAKRAPMPWLYRSPGRSGELEQAVGR